MSKNYDCNKAWERALAMQPGDVMHVDVFLVDLLEEIEMEHPEINLSNDRQKVDK